MRCQITHFQKDPPSPTSFYSRSVTRLSNNTILDQIRHTDAKEEIIKYHQ